MLLAWPLIRGVIRQDQLSLFNHVIAIGVCLVSSAFAYSVYVKSGQATEATYWSIYAFGAIFIPGIFTAYPGFKKVRDITGLETKQPRGRNLSRFQSIAIFSWIVGLGLVLLYVTEFKTP